MQIRNPFSCIAAFVALILAVPLAAQQSNQNSRPGEPGHATHKEWQGAYPSLASQKSFKVIRTLPLPDGFLGNLTYDQASRRLWLISVGPPTNKRGSTLYEINPESGAVIAQAPMPFKGDLSQPVYADGVLYEAVFHESTIYKVQVSDRASFGAIVGTVPLPTLNDLKLGAESHPVPFIEIGGVTLNPNNDLVVHADDVGELITLDRHTGKILARVRTLKAIGGIAGVAGNDNTFYVLGNSDPRGGYCALSFPPALSRTPAQKDISWALIDSLTGEVLASIRTQNSRAYASTVALKSRENTPESPYGRLTFFATGEEGLIELQWMPVRDAY